MKWPNRPSELIRQMVHLVRDRVRLTNEMFEGHEEKLQALHFFLEGQVGAGLRKLGFEKPNEIANIRSGFSSFQMGKEEQDSMLELAYDLEQHGL